MSGLPATPAARDTRPPAAGPMLRYLSDLNSFGYSGFAIFWASCAPADTTNAMAAATAKKFRVYDMRGVYHPHIP